MEPLRQITFIGDISMEKVDAIISMSILTLSIIYAILIALPILRIIIFSMAFLWASMTIIFGLSRVKNWEPYEPTVSIIVPVYNEEKYIAETLRRIVECDYPPSKKEIIVVNTGSIDGTWDEIKPFVDKGYVIGINIAERRTKREAIYEGLRISKGEITILVDSDSFLEPTAIREIVKPFKNPKVGAVAGNIKVAAPRNFLRKFQDSFYHWNFEFILKAQGRFGAVACCGGPFAAYRTSKLKDVAEQWKNEKFYGYSATFGDDRVLTLLFLKTMM